MRRTCSIASTTATPLGRLVVETRSPRRVSTHVEEVPSTCEGRCRVSPGPSTPRSGARGKPGTDFGCEILVARSAAAELASGSPEDGERNVLQQGGAVAQLEQQETVARQLRA